MKQKVNHIIFGIKIGSIYTGDAWPYLYTDGFSEELTFFAQARPRRIIRLQYKSGQWSCKCYKMSQRRNPTGNQAILVFSGQKLCTRIISTTLLLFKYFLKAKDLNSCKKFYQKYFLVRTREKISNLREIPQTRVNFYFSNIFKCFKCTSKFDFDIWCW